SLSASPPVRSMPVAKAKKLALKISSRYDSKARGGDSLKETLLKVRWRLLTGAVALLAAVAVTLPAAASRVDLGQRVAEIWPNATSEMAEIWPNATDVMD